MLRPEGSAGSAIMLYLVLGEERPGPAMYLGMHGEREAPGAV